MPTLSSRMGTTTRTHTRTTVRTQRLSSSTEGSGLCPGTIDFSTGPVRLNRWNAIRSSGSKFVWVPPGASG